MVATNLSGPRRVAWGAMRDHVMGIRAVTGRGEVIHSGGRVLKNVTGLDLCKLLTGSHGTLGVITEVTLKVLPAPEAVGTLVLPGLDAAAGGGGAVGGARLALRRLRRRLAAGRRRPRGCRTLAGFGRSRRADRGSRISPPRSPIAPRGCVANSAMLGARHPRRCGVARRCGARCATPRRCRSTTGDAVWRVSVRPSAGPAVLRSRRRGVARGYLDWGGGLVWLAGPAPPRRTATARMAAGGPGCARGPLRHAVVIRPSRWRDHRGEGGARSAGSEPGRMYGL